MQWLGARGGGKKGEFGGGREIGSTIKLSKRPTVITCARKFAIYLAEEAIAHNNQMNKVVSWSLRWIHVDCLAVRGVSDGCTSTMPIAW